VRHSAPTQEDLVAAVAATRVRARRVLDALREVPRAGFVPAGHEARAYLDEPIPIPHGQVTTQPSLVARMVEALELEGSEAVLEVGTGYGFQTALLARLASFVWSLERWPDLARAAVGNLARHGVHNAQVVVGDGTLGLPDHAPYHAIVVSAAFPEVPAPLAEQLGAGGRLVQPLGEGGAEEVVLFAKRGDRLVPLRALTGARFVRLVGELGFEEEAARRGSDRGRRGFRR
jgi:protein-L-isoaspartate(D-aspartate) O-methyltransferase